jgi:hypothetical protein
MLFEKAISRAGSGQVLDRYPRSSIHWISNANTVGTSSYKRRDRQLLVYD